MSDFIREYEFETSPLEITYGDGDPLELSKEFSFFHNKITFRKELTRLQNFMKDNLNTPLLAAGIRDSYLKEEYSKNYLILLFTTFEIHKDVNKFIEPHETKVINPGCFYIETKSKYMYIT